MKTTELRIGNYHLYRIVDLLDERKSWDEICQIDADDLVWLSKPEGENDPAFKPVPLTEEWLERFWFESWGNEVYTEYENHHIYCLHNVIDGTSDFKVYLSESWYGVKELTPEEIFKNTVKQWGIKIDHDILYVYYELKYVHQLQNLYFALTGQELTIKSDNQ